MSVRTLLLYLLGSPRAILDIASDRRAVGLGFLFVLSAGFAREYDGQDLLHEPWHLLIPVGASLLTSFLFFSLTYGVVRVKTEGPPFFTAYRSFLGLFWMTAPLAWLYAIPYERFLSAPGAMQANLWTLGLVSLWRVFLMVRVISVLMGYRTIAALCLVMALADVEALVAIQFLPVPLIDVMAGLRLSESEALLRGTALEVAFLGGCTLLGWMTGAAVAAVVSKPGWQGLPLEAYQPKTRDRGLSILAWASVVFWFFVLPFTQPEQLMRCKVERDLRQGRIEQALATMSEHSLNDFPPHWDPPPRWGYIGQPPSLFHVLDTIVDHPPALWVRSAYLSKFERALDVEYPPFRREDYLRIASLLERLPEGPRLTEMVANRGWKRFLEGPRHESEERQDQSKK